MTTWIFRACVVFGIQQIYILVLWYWGSLIHKQAPGASVYAQVVSGSPVPKILIITVPIAVMLWVVGLIIFFGLPDFYRQNAAKIPSFWRSMLRRKIVPWYCLMIIVQNYFMSVQYGRNWMFLFSSRQAPGWAIFLLTVLFFGVFWSLIMYGFSLVGKSHPWLLPIFASGMGAPRWAQMLWGVSGIGLYLPWAGNAVASAMLSRSLWLWLGLLDAIHGVGVGMVLLLTLTRQHVMTTLVAGQVIGSAVLMISRATSPNATGPGEVFPDFSEGLYPGISKPIFWVALLLQLFIPIGFFAFFRKEQISKP